MLRIALRIVPGLMGLTGLLYCVFQQDSALLWQLPGGGSAAEELRYLFFLFPLLCSLIAWLEGRDRQGYLRRLLQLIPCLSPFSLLLIPAPLWIERSLFAMSAALFLILLFLLSGELLQLTRSLADFISEYLIPILVLFLLSMALLQLITYVRLGEQYAAFIFHNDLPNVRKARMPARFLLVFLTLAGLFWLIRPRIPVVPAKPRTFPLVFMSHWLEKLLSLPAFLRISLFLLVGFPLLYYLYYVDPFLGFRHPFLTQLWILLVAFSAVMALKELLERFFDQRSFTVLLFALFLLSFLLIPRSIVDEALVRLDLFLPNQLDMGIQNQVMWTLAFQGSPQLAIGSPDGVYNTHYFRDHVPLFYFLVAPIYRLQPSPQTLIYLQSFFLYLGIIPWMALVRRLTGSWNLTWIAGLIYLYYPALQILQLFDVHEAVFSIPLFLCALVFLEASRVSARPLLLEVLFGFFLFLAGLVREEMGLFSVSLGIFLFFRREIRPAVIAFCLGAGQFIVMSMIIQRSFGSGGHYERYAPLFFLDGEYSVISILQLLVLNPVYFCKQWWDPARVLFLVKLTVPFLFLTFADRKFLALYLAGFASTILATSSPNWTVGYQYSVILVVAFFYGAILSLSSLRSSRRRLLATGSLIASFSAMITTGVFLAPLTWLSFLGPYASLKGEVQDRWIHLGRRLPDDTYGDLRSLLEEVPERVSIAVNEDRLIPLLSGRPVAYILPVREPTDCVVQYPAFGGTILEDATLKQIGYERRARRGGATLHCLAHVH